MPAIVTTLLVVCGMRISAPPAAVTTMPFFVAELSAVRLLILRTKPSAVFVNVYVPSATFSSVTSSSLSVKPLGMPSISM